VVIARDSGNRLNETHVAVIVSSLEAECGDPLAALDYFTVAIRDYHDSGNIFIPSPLPCWPPFSTGSDTTNRQPSPVSQSVPSPQRRLLS
jgi:hypothetical protein